MDNFIHLDANSSTTRHLIEKKPVITYDPIYKLEPKLFLTPTSERQGEGGLRTKGLCKKSYKGKPLISIVTVVYNGDKHLEQTIQSVLKQTYNNIEYIIIDGGSTDNSLNIIKKYSGQIDYWISEPDSGIYNAMNKGISLCTGEYIAFLNADDWYNLDTLELVSKAAEGNNDFICGDVKILSIDDTAADTIMKVDIDNYKVRMPLGHPALFVKRFHLLKYGFDESYRIIADYDFVLKLIEDYISHAYIQQPLTNFRLGGISSSEDLRKERLKLYYNHFGLGYALSYFIKQSENPLLRSVKLLIKWLIRYNK